MKKLFFAAGLMLLVNTAFAQSTSTAPKIDQTFAKLDQILGSIKLEDVMGRLFNGIDADRLSELVQSELKQGIVNLGKPAAASTPSAAEQEMTLTSQKLSANVESAVADLLPHVKPLLADLVSGVFAQVRQEIKTRN